MGASLSMLGDTILGVEQVMGLLLADGAKLEAISHGSFSFSVYNSDLFILEKESRKRNFGYPGVIIFAHLQR